MGANFLLHPQPIQGSRRWPGFGLGVAGTTARTNRVATTKPWIVKVLRIVNLTAAVTPLRYAFVCSGPFAGYPIEGMNGSDGGVD